MYRALLTLTALFTVPVAFTQSVEVAHKSPPRTLIKAKCAFPDGTVVGNQLIEVAASASLEEKRAAAEQACRPVMEAASAKCDELANRVDALKSEWRIAVLYSARAHELKTAIKQALADAPAYC